MEPLHLRPPRWFLHLQFVGWIVCSGVGLLILAVGLRPEVLAGAFVAGMGTCIVLPSVWAALRNYRVQVILDETTMTIQGWLWSRRVPRDDITAVWRGGQVQYDGQRGHSESAWIVWLMRNGPDDDASVIGRLQSPLRAAEADIRQWAGVHNPL
jgi:hypothetical protein